MCLYETEMKAYRLGVTVVMSLMLFQEKYNENKRDCGRDEGSLENIYPWFNNFRTASSQRLKACHQAAIDTERLYK